MTDLILVRLHPGEQTDPNTFTQALQGLQITAYDLTVANPGQPVQIGTASGLAGLPSENDGNIENDKVDLIAGIVHSGVAISIRDMVTNAKVPVIITNAGAWDLTGKLKNLGALCADVDRNALLSAKVDTRQLRTVIVEEMHA